MNFTMECEKEVDGRWIAEVPQLHGVLAYGSSSPDAMTKAEVLVLRVIAEQLKNGESQPISINTGVNRNWVKGRLFNPILLDYYYPISKK